jgi:hypothetical protein
LTWYVDVSRREARCWTALVRLVLDAQVSAAKQSLLSFLEGFFPTERHHKPKQIQSEDDIRRIAAAYQQNGMAYDLDGRAKPPPDC